MEGACYRAGHQMIRRDVLRRFACGAALALIAGCLFDIPAYAAPLRQSLQQIHESPSDWADTCSSGGLGLGSDHLELAQPLINHPDTNPDGSPVMIKPDQRGKYVPVIMVHGWTSKDTQPSDGNRDGAFSHLIDLTTNRVVGVSTTRSVIGQLQRIAGTAVFTFDYRDYAASWVDDQHLGPAMGKVIDCLYKASGEKVIIVGHSMGGLVARWAAANPGISGPDRASEISTVVTFGTPETGSVAAALVNTVTDAAATTNDYAAVVRLILATCGQLSINAIQTGTLCDTLPAPIRTFDSAAGIALRAGSPQLAALKPFPKSISVDALAGNATFEVPNIGWFGITTSTTAIPVGDLIVTEASAFTGADMTRQASCDYQLSPVRGATDTLGLALGLVSKSDVAEQPLAAFAGACFHTNLMRDIELTNEAVGAVNDDISAQQGPVIPPTTVITNTPYLTDGSLRLPIDPASSALAGSDCEGGPITSSGFFSCGTTAASLKECWREPADSTGAVWVDCLHDPRDKLIDHFRAGTIFVDAVNRDPWALRLADGTVCTVRTGGAWGPAPPGTAWTFQCDGKTGALASPKGGPLIDKSHATWTALAADPDSNSPVATQVNIAAAYIGGITPDLPRVTQGGACPPPQILATAEGGQLDPTALVCTSDWATGGYGDGGIGYVGVIHRTGSRWAAFDRSKACAYPGPMPVTIWSAACTSD